MIIETNQHGNSDLNQPPVTPGEMAGSTDIQLTPADREFFDRHGITDRVIAERQNRAMNELKRQQDQELAKLPVVPAPEASLTHNRRRLSGKKILLAGVVAAAVGASALGTGNIQMPDFGNIFIRQSSQSTDGQGDYPDQVKNPDSNPYEIGEGQPKDEHMVLSDRSYYFQEEMLGYLNYVPDGAISYWTTKDGKKRYLFPGGDENPFKGWVGNATYLLETDGNKSLKDVLLSGAISAGSFTQVLAPNTPPSEEMEGEWYSSITAVVQSPDNPDVLVGVGQRELRPNRNASDAYQASVQLVRSTDGGMTWEKEGFIIKGSDPRNPGYVDSNGDTRVTGAGEPSCIYNPVDGYIYISWVDWRGEKRPTETKREDDIYLARAKMDSSWEMGQLEYLTQNGWSTEFDGNKIKPIVTTPSEDFVYVALPKLSWNTDANEWQITGEADNGFWQSYSKNLTDWSTPSLFFRFSDPITQYQKPMPNPDEPGSTAGPSYPTTVNGEPHDTLQKGQIWYSYPTIISPQYPNSTLTGNEGQVWFSEGDNETFHEPAEIDFTMVGN